MNSLRRFLILHKPQDDARAAADAVGLRLAGHGCCAAVLPSTAPEADIHASAANADAIIMVGGDGSIIGAARKLTDLATPIVGLNFGFVGFLAELPAEGWEAQLDDIVAGKWIEENHIALKWRIMQEDRGGCEAEGFAINDVIVSHGLVARAVSLRITVDGIDFDGFRGDGVIISTPLGSTAYNASAGGPLTLPSMDAQLLTPICPSFVRAFPHFVLPVHSVIRITVERPTDDVVISSTARKTIPSASDPSLRSRGRRESSTCL
ncbi:MAG: NAD(+)/NADH kinase [Mailhella sp.]|nr:NAD(+)/NADH kinase [Mailhella sp.]